MKKLISALALITSSAIFTSATAQVHVNINIGTQPVWGPVGYDYAEYYYLPDIDAYYDVPQRQFIYLEGRNWRFANALPPMYGNFDLYRSYKVVINEPRPYLHHEVYYKKYYGYRGRRGQPFIRESDEERYWQIKEHPQHGKWKQNGGNNGKGHGNGHGNGNGHGKGHGHD